jgi:hypothetical protein
LFEIHYTSAFLEWHYFIETKSGILSIVNKSFRFRGLKLTALKVARPLIDFKIQLSVMGKE